jgi:hypothetical protein
MPSRRTEAGPRSSGQERGAREHAAALSMRLGTAAAAEIDPRAHLLDPVDVCHCGCVGALAGTEAARAGVPGRDASRHRPTFFFFFFFEKQNF